ncbi:MAG: histidinol dehydrogenase [Deltaproteobacteria bacterium]|nr:histidinol dehydrogenase [Deltaproteobacteria bacterium]MBN2673783.1 histidinol dehydrogenase [Deltaproteobacteria bacterium]
MLLQKIEKSEIGARNALAVDAEAENTVRGIINDVCKRGIDALYEYSVKFGDIEKGASVVIPKEQLKEAAHQIPKEDAALLKRTAARIETFARAQLNSVHELAVPIPGGKAGHKIAPVERACCYAPGGRFPLPSSVLMTAVTAKVAGVSEVWVTSPKPVPVTLAAAYYAGADGFAAVGGAQAVAAFAYGAGDIPACDIIVGPGNKYVTAAKKLVSGHVAIDMLAGPSELTVLADASADAAVIAADLLAQAEHDVVAVPILVTTSDDLIDRVNIELESQLEVLSTAETATESLKNGFAIHVDSIDEGTSICNRLGPEHLEILTADAATVAKKCTNYGGLFIGQGTAEVLGDYGAGPNHTLPTGGTSRYTGGLSVFDFLRIRTWIEITNKDAAQPLVEDAARLAQLEGLEGHMKSALKRKK